VIKATDRILGLLFAVLFLFTPRSGDEQVVRAELVTFLVTTLVTAIVLILLTELLRPKPKFEDARPAGLGDFEFPTATEGRVVPLLWGTVRLKGPNVVWYGDLSQDAITQRVKTGLWDSQRIIKGFRYRVGMQMALCRGPNCVLKTVWIGDDIVYEGSVTNEQTFDINEPNLFGGDDYGGGGIQATCDFFAGNNPQNVSDYLSANTNRQLVSSATTPTAPAYHGTCYVIARELAAADAASSRGAILGNSTSIKPWSFEVQRLPALIPGQSAGGNAVNTVDANPVNVLYEILVNSEWGFGFNNADIDLSAFVAAANTVKSEGNGFSFVLTRQLSGVDLISELERQIDGVVQLDISTGLWTIVLARQDYDIDDVPQVTEDNTIKINEFSRGTWDETTNVITVQYNKREDEYKESFAVAQDMGNALIRGGGTVSTFKPVTAQMNFPGVKDEALAVNLAWRELRQKTYPLARVDFVLNREFYNLKVGQVIAWTTPTLGFTKLPLRVGKVDLGRLEKGEIVVSCVQDIFGFQAASFGDPVGTGWTPPEVGLAAIPSDEQLVIEAPRAIVVRDPFYEGDPLVAKVFASGRAQGSELGIDIFQRNAAGTPSGSYSLAGDILGFSLIGELKSDLKDGTAIPTATINLVGDPDSRTLIEAAFDDSATAPDLGQSLVNLIYVDGEFMLVSSASISGTDVVLANVYRGVLDSVQKTHTAGTKVFLINNGSALTDTNFPQGNQVDIELRPRSDREVFAGSVSTVNLTMQRRTYRPYPPASITWDGVSYSAMDVEANGSGLNGQNIDFSFLRRNFLTNDEVSAKLADASDVLASTEYRVRMFWDDNELTDADAWSTVSPIEWTTSVPTVNIERRYLINEASIDSEFRIEVQTRHDYEGQTDIEALQTLIHKVVPTSEYNGLTYLGGNSLQLANSYTAAADGTYTVNIGQAYTLADVEYRIDGGSWTTVIAMGNTTGNITGVTTGEEIELRINTDDSPMANVVEITFASNPVAYGAFSGSGFDPGSISSLLIWIDPSDSGTTTTSGSPLRYTAITDKETSPSSEDLSSPSGVNNALVDTLGSRDSMACDSDGALTFGNASAFSVTNGPFTIAVAFELDSTLAGAVTTFASLFRKIGAAGFGIDYQNSGANLDRLRFFVFLNSTAYDVGTTGVTKDTTHVLVCSRNNSTGAITAWLDGVSLGTTATVSPAGGINNSSHAFLGAANDTASTARLPFCGRIGEFMFFDAELSTGDRNALESYLLGRWS
jgi:flagellin-like hook-associated protein FlgL